MQENQELPQGWVTTSLGKLLAFEYGKALIEKDRNQTGEINVFGSSGSVGKHSSSYVNSPCLIIGRKGNVGSVYISREPCWPIDTAYFCLPPPWLDLQFTYYLLRYLKLGKLDKSTAIPGLNRNDAYSSEVLLPPLPEQRRIVAKLEELFSRWEAGVAALRQTQAQLKRYRQAVLHAAVTGELTRTWREAHPTPTESGAALLARIRQERRAQWEAAQLAKRGGQLPLGDVWKKKYEEPAAPDTSELPELPTEWTWASVEQISDLDVGFAFKSEQFSKQGIRLLRGENIEPGALRWKDVRYWPENKAESFEKYLIREGEIILAMDRPLISSGLKLARAKSSDLPCLLVQRMARFRPVEAGATSYLYFFLQTQQAISHLLGGQTGTQLPHISGRGIVSMLLPLPPLAEQAEIVAEVERHLSVLDELEHTLRAELTRAERLRQSILHRAFTGRLVPQDPTDEPAAALLARLQAEVPAGAATKAKRGRKAGAQLGMTF